MEQNREADICLILEGSYPYVSGGVSTWTHRLIQTQQSYTFHLLCLLPPNHSQQPKYELPANVVGHTNIILQQLPTGANSWRRENISQLFKDIELSLLHLQHRPKLSVLENLIKHLRSYSFELGAKELLNSKEAWGMILRLYRQTTPDCSFLNFFWSMRGILSGLFSVLLGPLPKAHVYHSLSTGYAGLYMARASIETQRPCFITEHGIYTNERKIEIASAQWLEDIDSMNLSIETASYNRDLKDIWIDTFYGYSLLSYTVADKILTLFEGNQELQLADGATPQKLGVIPNGVNIPLYSNLQRKSHSQPTIAFIGRIVPIKDVKTYIRAVHQIAQALPQLKAYIIGPFDEDQDYYEECLALIQNLALEKTIELTGKVNIKEYLPLIDLIVLTSISESQPLVILEAGAAGIPTVATDVGACREMILGSKRENPPLGVGGGICQLADPLSTAKEVIKLLKDREFYEMCSRNISKRVAEYYSETDMTEAYRTLYREYVEKKDESLILSN